MARATHRIIGVCGSLQAKSSNLELLTRAAALSTPELEVAITDALRHLPLFNLDLADNPPSPVEAWRQALATSDGVLITCPEYGHSLPGALKNAIDWVIGSGEFYRKPVAITAAVRAPERGRNGLGALKQTLRAVDAHIIWEDPLVLSERTDEDLKLILSQLAQGIAQAKSGE